MVSIKPSFSLRPFQARVLAHHINGRNVLLQAPTGAGKTQAATAPFLQNLANNADYLPLTCRYAVPMRVLANQFYTSHRHLAETLDRASGTNLESIYSYFQQRPIQIQTGEQPDDPHFESALTFCTIDQLLASFLGIPYSVGARRANMNVGAVVGSYLVLDEFHLYPLGRDGKGTYGARTTALQMLHLLNHGKRRLSPFTLMTATFSSGLLKKLAELLEAEIVAIQTEASEPGKPSELDVLNAGRTRRFVTHRMPMDAHTIVEQHQGCTLVVCNTVARAQEMYLHIRNALREQKRTSDLLLLHSRFTGEHRRAKQELLEKELGAACWDGNTYIGSDLIVVATQVVEVGLDISVRTLHSEIAPANSIIQRAGRCARFAGQDGNVHLYPLADDVKHLPYDTQLSLATLDAFAQYDQQIVDFPREQAVIDSVHGVEDTAMIAAFEHERSLITEKIFKGLGLHDRGIASELIRNVQQSTLVIHPDPNAALTERPWEWQTFSLSPYSLQARWEDMQAHSDGEPVLWEAQLLPDASEPGTRVPARYTWVPLTAPARIPTAFMIALAPTIASYTQECGFQLRDSRSTLPWPQVVFESQHRAPLKRNKDFAPYEQESYAEHIRGLLNAFRYSRLQDDTRYIARQLDTLLGLPAGSVHHAMRLAIACHDIGKLSEGWQGWALAWQQRLAGAFGQEHYEPRKAPFAHTDYDWKIHRDLERGFKPTRPNHAGESAFFAMPFIYAATKNQVLTQVVIAAIARHHNATTQNYSLQRLIPDAKTHIAAMLHEAQIAPEAMSAELRPIQSAGEFNHHRMTMPRQEIQAETWLYFVLVRVLRLADGRSFQYKG